MTPGDPNMPSTLPRPLVEYSANSLKPNRRVASYRQAEGHLETTTWKDVSGWIWFPESQQRRAVLEIIHEGSVFATIVANQPRADLKAADIGDGCYGFQFKLPKEVFAEAAVLFRVREQSTSLDVNGSPFVLTNDTASIQNVKGDVARIVDIIAQIGTEDEALSLATFLLGQHDRAAARHQTLVKDRRDGIRNWAESFERLGPISEIVQNLLATARYQYGEDILAIPTSAEPEVSIIMPVHGKFWYTHRCLRSIVEHLPQRTFELIIVDDCSTDETLLASMLLSGVKLLRNEVNLGFVGSVNAGAAVAKGRWILLLNNDTEVTPGWLDELCDTFLRDCRVGIAGSKLVFPNGRLQEVGGIIWRFADGANRGRDGDPDDPRYCYLRDSDYVSGAALMIERLLWDEVGGLTQDFAPAYYEDTDLCFKVRAAGRRVVVQPHSCIIHHEGVSAGSDVAGTGMKRFQRINQAKFAKRWASTLAEHGVNGSDPVMEDARYVTKRVLFIDDSVPTPDRDAGSNAAFEHMLALQRVGYEVHFVPADNMACIPPYTAALERRGIRCYHTPFMWSVEEVLRRSDYKFDLAYIHRPGNASKYTSVIRSLHPTARIVFNVADLHYLRMEREAVLRDRQDLLEPAARMRELELAALRAVDHVITHSETEAKLISDALPGVQATVIPWTVVPEPPALSFEDRNGIAFVGSFNHPPNRDAAKWLAYEIMPLVWQQDPSIRLSIIGSSITAADHSMASDRLEIVGWVPDIAKALHLYRLTIAPLRYGAGLKGKVINSFAAGLPVIMTPISAEGINLPPPLDQLITDTPASMADLIVSIYNDSRRGQLLSEAGLRFVAETYSRASVDRLIEAVACGG